MAFSKILALSAVLASYLIAPVAGAQDLAAKGEWTAYSAGSAALPPMGWNSWNAFNSDIDEEKVLGSARALVETGLASKGYRYVNIDDGWWLNRRASDRRLVIRGDRFPSAVLAGGETSFRPLTDRLHAMGLKAGIYSDIGRNSCGQVYTSTLPNQPEGSVLEREVGLYENVDRDIRLYFVDWGFDFIKVDGCGIRGLAPTDPRVEAGQYRALGPFIDAEALGRTDIPRVRNLYEEVGEALHRHNPDGDYVFSICIWGAADVRSWGKDVGNMSRTSEDILPTWGRMLHNLDSVARRPLYAHPKSWNDPDMLFVGSGDFDANHLVEARSHFSLWAMVNAPLIIGYDLRQADPALMEILGNEQVIAVNQDPSGNQSVLAYDSDEILIFVKTLASGEKAVAIFNRTAAPLEAVLTASHLKFLPEANVQLVDLWNGSTATFQGEQAFSLQPRETRVFRARGSRRLADGMYLSEQPGMVNPASDGVVVPEPEPLIHRGMLPWRSTRVAVEAPRYGGWGGAQADRTPYGGELAVAGRRFDTGIGVLANSRIEVRNWGARRFVAEVGVDDSARDRTQPVVFEVYGDGRLLSRTAALTFGAAPVRVEVDIGTVQIVELIARTAEPTRFPDPVAWANAALVN